MQAAPPIFVFFSLRKSREEMNKQLLDPFESDYPERIEEELQHGSLHARCCAFNRRGTLLATGCHEGAAVLWDFDTRGVVKVLQVASMGITCMCTCTHVHAS